MVEEIEQIRIGIAEGAIVSGNGSITTAGLGSCVGLVIYDEDLDLAGMVHVMLPISPKSDPPHPQKYADTALPWLTESLIRRGASLYRLRAKYAGGSQMFKSLQMDALRIGDRNVESVSNLLAALNIPVIGCDVGGNYGRTVRFELSSRMFHIRTARGEERQI